MSESTRIEGTRVYCHVCEHEWDRDQGGLQCPSCESEFVEILDDNNRSQNDQPPESGVMQPTISSPRYRSHPTQSLNLHNPWAPDPDEDDITTFEFNAAGGRGTFSYTSRTYVFGGNGRNGADHAQAEIGRSFESMLGNIMGMHNSRSPAHISGSRGYMRFPSNTQNSTPFGATNPTYPQDLFQMLFQSPPNGTRQQNQFSSPFDFLSAMLNPGSAQHGDTVFSQEAFDRVMTQLMEQNQTSGAPGPASEAAINSLQKKIIDQTDMGSDGKAECSICMDGVDIGDQVTTLPCKHWFHRDCVVSWLKEHDTCPHCRKPISTPQNSNQHSQSSGRETVDNGSPRASRSNPLQTLHNYQTISQDHLSPLHPNTSPHSTFSVSSPAQPTEPRQQYYGASHQSNMGTPDGEGHSRTQGGRDANNAGVGGWLRNHLPFS